MKPMKCGDCKHWNPRLNGETYNDLFRTIEADESVIGNCEYYRDENYPMFNHEECTQDND